MIDALGRVTDGIRANIDNGYFHGGLLSSV